MIPTFNRPQLLKQAIRSALAQRGDVPIEVVVIDNDAECQFNAEAITASFNDVRLQYVRNQSNYGMCGNWNRCLELARADWLTILHDDDLLHPDYLLNMFPLFSTSPQLSAIGCGVIEVSTEDYNVGSLAPAENRLGLLFLNRFDIMRGCPFYVAGVALCRYRALELGGFDVKKYPSMDYDLWFRLFSNGTTALLPRRLAVYRKFENESARPDVLAGFLQSAYEIRGKLIETFSSPVRGLLYNYSVARLTDDRIALENAWGMAVAGGNHARTDGDPTYPLARRLLYKLVKLVVVFASARRLYILAR